MGTIVTRPLFIDLGNRFLKFKTSNSAAKIFVSCYADVLGNSQPNIDLSTSVDIQYLDGNSHYQGKRWIVGASARELNNYSNTMNALNKTEDALKLVLATVQPSNQKETSLIFDPLYITVPDPQQDQDPLLKLLPGEHQISYNGAEILVKFGTINVVAEGEAGFYYAIQQGVLPKNKLNGILDIGGGTTIGALFNARGQEIRDARVVLRKSGAFGLATQITSDPAMKAIARGAAAIDKVLDGIERGDYLYGNTGESFKALFDIYHPVWLKKLVSEIVARWDFYLDDLQNIAIIGGSAPLAAPLISNPSNRWFKRCPNPQLANLFGLATLKAGAV